VAGTIVVSDIRSDNDNTITFTSNTGETIFTANLSSGIDGNFLANTGVTAAVYGGASQIPVVTVDEKGRITSAANVGVSIPSFDSPLNIVADDTGGAEIRLPEDTDNGVNFVALKANSSIASNVTFVLPNADGTSNQVLRTDGSGNLSFITVGSVGSANISAGDSNVTVVDSGTGRVEMNVDGSTRAIFNEYGLGLGPNVPSSGIGIRFPASQIPSADANTLDDYEEGTWTPISSTGGWTFSIDDAQYVKIGKQVSVWASITNTGSGNGSQIVIGGLPFSVPANCYAVSVFDTGGNSKTGSYIRANSGGTLAYAWYVSTSRQSLLGTDISSSSYILFNWTYFV
jgi:hypothetical protein